MNFTLVRVNDTLTLPNGDKYTVTCVGDEAMRVRSVSTRLYSTLDRTLFESMPFTKLVPRLKPADNHTKIEWTPFDEDSRPNDHLGPHESFLVVRHRAFNENAIFTVCRNLETVSAVAKHKDFWWAYLGKAPT